MIDTLLGLSILFPIIIGLICLGIENHKIRGGVVYFTTIVLIVSSILLVRQGSFPLEYTAAPAWDWVILAFDYIILAYFLFVAIRELAQESVDIFGGKADAGRSC